MAAFMVAIIFYFMKPVDVSNNQDETVSIKEDERTVAIPTPMSEISTVEASAAGAVPVVIGKGGQKEIVEDGKNGFLWTTKTQLFEKTLELVKNPKVLERVSKNAIKNSHRFSREKFFFEYEKIIY